MLKRYTVNLCGSTYEDKSGSWVKIEDVGVLQQVVADCIKALDDLGVTPNEARWGAERSRAKDLRIAELESDLIKHGEICLAVGKAYARDRIAELEAQNEEMCHMLDGMETCCCGSYVKDHGYTDNHGPVSMFDHFVSCQTDKARQEGYKAGMLAAADIVDDLWYDSVISGSLRETAEGKELTFK